MRLQNKKTGEIKDLQEIMHEAFCEHNEKSLMNLEKDWEDAPEEPKKYYYLDYGGRIKAMNDANDEEDMVRKAIGNYFETKEEAEKSVEKLKAWERLRDKGFRFEGIRQDYTRFNQQEPMMCGRKYLQFNKSEDEEWMKDNWEDLDLLFGGEE
jgi:hypothetical protein